MKEIKVNLCYEEFESLKNGKTIDLVEIDNKIVKLSYDKNKDIDGE